MNVYIQIRRLYIIFFLTLIEFECYFWNFYQIANAIECFQVPRRRKRKLKRKKKLSAMALRSLLTRPSSLLERASPSKVKVLKRPYYLSGKYHALYRHIWYGTVLGKRKYFKSVTVRWRTANFFFSCRNLNRLCLKYRTWSQQKLNHSDHRVNTTSYIEKACLHNRIGRNWCKFSRPECATSQLDVIQLSVSCHESRVCASLLLLFSE